MRLWIITFGLCQLLSATPTSDVIQCSRQLLSILESPENLNPRKYFGGIEEVGGLSVLDTTQILTPQIGKAMLALFFASVPEGEDMLELGPNSDVTALSCLVESHRLLVWSQLERMHPDWKWETSTLLLTYRPLIPDFHDHAHFSASRVWGVASLLRGGTIFRSLSGEQLYQAAHGETCLFDKWTPHKSAGENFHGLFLHHHFSRADSK